MLTAEKFLVLSFFIYPVLVLLAAKSSAGIIAVTLGIKVCVYGYFFYVSYILTGLTSHDGPISVDNASLNSVTKNSGSKAYRTGCLLTILFPLIFIAAGFKLPETFATPFGEIVGLGANQSIIFQEPATLEEAKSVGAVLQQFGIISPRRKSTAQLQKQDSLYLVRLVVLQQTLEQPEAKLQPLIEEFAHLGFVISKTALKGAPVQVELCDSNLKTVTTIEMKAKES